MLLRNIIAVLALSTVFLFAGPVSYYGRMKASGNRIIGENTNTAVQVRGMSFFWSCIDWDDGKYANFWTAATVDAMVDGWKSEILRAAMAANADNGCGDYQSKKTQTIQMVKTVVDRAIERDIYVIIDWHSHKAHDQQAQVINFFVNEMSEYHNDPHVIFEIYNEPEQIAWSSVKSYSNAVITAIRNAGANNLILVGTPNWDQDVDYGPKDPVSDSDGNVAYVLHFYAAEHTLGSRTMASWSNNDASKTFQKTAETALSLEKPIFVSEYGTVEASGNGNFSSSESNKWHAFMDQNKISSCNWSINNKAEGASAFVSSFSIPTSGSAAAWTNTNNMTPSGSYIFGKLTSYATSAEWRNAPPPVSSSSGGGSSSSGTSPIMLSQVNANEIQLVKNGVFLQVVNNATLEVFDLKGNLLRKVNLENGSHTVSLSTLPKGLYIARISFNGQRQVINIPIR
jgi:endoglucanase